jgi:hypothetical protein
MTRADGWLIVVLFMILFALLTGCATSTPPPPKVVAGVTTVEPIKVPVLVPCLTREQIPSPPASYMHPSRSGWHNQVAAEADLRQLDEYVVRSQSLMHGCAKALEETKP